MKYNLQDLNLNELRIAIRAAWEAVPEEFLLTLAHSMPERLRKVIENNGDRIGC